MKCIIAKTLSTSKQTKLCCPLRLDEPTVATVQTLDRSHIINSRRRTKSISNNKISCNNITKQNSMFSQHCHRCASSQLVADRQTFREEKEDVSNSGGSFTRHPHQNLVNHQQQYVQNTNQFTSSRPLKGRHSNNDRCNKSLITCWTSKHLPVQPFKLLLLVGCLFYLTTLQLTLAQQSTFIAAPTYPNPLDAPTSPSSCPLVPVCQCKWINGKKVANCEKRNLEVIPANLPQDTLVLDLASSKLSQLTAHVFQDKHLTNLQKIYLSDCKISFIADQAFAQLTNLIELDLSHNYLQQVPVKSFEQLNHSLRKLSLAHNAIQTIETDTFSTLSHLNSLDLSSCQLSQLKPNAFRGLNELKELKLYENKLTALPMNVVEDLRDYLILDLYNNRWNCDCELRQSIDWMNRHHVQQSSQPTCETPQKHKDMRWISVKAEDYICPPVVVTKQHELVVGVGSNVSLLCSARGSPPLTFVWFQDEKNLTTNRSISGDSPASTKLLEEKRYEIAEEFGAANYGFNSNNNLTTSILYLYNLQLSDTSIFICWVENGAGYTLANFSLVVNDSPPAPISGFGSAAGNFATSFLNSFAINQNQEAQQLTLLFLGFICIIVAAIICLLVYRRSNQSSKSSQSSNSDLKHNNNNKSLHNGGHGISTISSSNKFSLTNGNVKSSSINKNNHRLSDSDSEDAVDEDLSADERSSATSSSRSGGSAGSCRKNPTKVMAAGELDGFIEHMRSGIINMDYHQMSPVIQFNNTLKKQQQQKQQQQQQQLQQQHYPLDRPPPNYSDDHQNHHLGQQHYHHFASPSNASSIPYYGGAPNGSASMATTTSDLSPAGSNTTNTLTNCDLQPIATQHHLLAAAAAASAPATNTTTTSFTSDYQSGYGIDAAMMPPMYYDSESSAAAHLQHHHLQPQLYGSGGALTVGGSRPNSMIAQQVSPMQMQQHLHHQQQQQLVMQDLIQARSTSAVTANNHQRHRLDSELHIL